MAIFYELKEEKEKVEKKKDEKRAVHVQLPTGVQVNEFPLEKFMRVEIEKVPQVGQDVVCGHFYGNMGDDTTEMKEMSHEWEPLNKNKPCG